MNSRVGGEAPARKSEGWIIAAALALSIGLLWLAVDDTLLVAAFAAGVIALGGAIFALTRRPPQAQAQEFALPDWSVTVTAIERPPPPPCR